MGLKAGATGAGGVGASGSLFSLPEEFRSDFGDLWGVNHLTVGDGKMGEEGIGGGNVGLEDEHEDTEISEDDISEDETEERSDDEENLWLDPGVAIPLEKVTTSAARQLGLHGKWDRVLTREIA